MKKLVLCVVMALIGAAAAMLVLSLVFRVDIMPDQDSAAETSLLGAAEDSGSPAGGASSEMTDAELVSYAYNIAECIKSRDYAGLSAFVHSEYGVVFSPYSTITLNSDKCFTPAQVATFGKDEMKYIWGVYDGSGEPIELTVSDYFDAFVFDADYTHASAVGVDYINRSGNSLENVTEAFPNSRFVEFYIAGKDSNVGFEDWSILRLVFEPDNGAMKLIAVIHSQWTV